jgi:hypothetical protein
VLSYTLESEHPPSGNRKPFSLPHALKIIYNQCQRIFRQGV